MAAWLPAPDTPHRTQSKRCVTLLQVRVNWAFQKDQREDTSNHYHIFVGDLGSEVTDSILFEAFQEFPSCSDARVMWDHVTSR